MAMTLCGQTVFAAASTFRVCCGVCSVFQRGPTPISSGECEAAYRWTRICLRLAVQSPTQTSGLNPQSQAAYPWPLVAFGVVTHSTAPQVAGRAPTAPSDAISISNRVPASGTFSRVGDKQSVWPIPQDVAADRRDTERRTLQQREGAEFSVHRQTAAACTGTHGLRIGVHACHRATMSS
jgi:hypothetical protein